MKPTTLAKALGPILARLAERVEPAVLGQVFDLPDGLLMELLGRLLGAFRDAGAIGADDIHDMLDTGIPADILRGFGLTVDTAFGSAGIELVDQDGDGDLDVVVTLAPPTRSPERERELEERAARRAANRRSPAERAADRAARKAARRV